jgi:hypothetical protein
LEVDGGAGRAGSHLTNKGFLWKPAVKVPFGHNEYSAQWKPQNGRASECERQRAWPLYGNDKSDDVGTKVLRDTGNLKLVQRALNHADMKTTTRYAHILDEEVAAALEQVQKSRRVTRKAG